MDRKKSDVASTSSFATIGFEAKLRLTAWVQHVICHLAR
jgi:hypothetical protein